MSETKSVHDWAKDWQALSQQYWSAWGDLARQAGAAPRFDVATPWHEGLEQWARLFGGAGRQSEVVERLGASAKSFVSLMQSMLSTAAGNDGAAASVWTDVLRQGFNLPGIDASLLNNPLAASLRDLSGKGAHSLEQGMAELLRLAAPVKQEWLNLLGTPAFGYAREHQERWQRLSAALAGYQEQTNRYNALILKASERGFERFQSKLAEREEPGRQLDSVRAVYDLWVDAAEEAYAQVAMTDEFREVYGDLVNAQMKVRSLVQREVELATAQLGMPTRTEMRSVEKAVHELRRAAKSREDGMASVSAAELAELKTELAELRRQVGAAKKKPAAARSVPKQAVKTSKSKR